MKILNWIKSFFKKKPQKIEKLDLDKGECWVINGIQGTFDKWPPIKFKVKDFSAVEKDPQKALRFLFSKEEALNYAFSVCTAPRAVQIIMAGLIIRKVQSGYMIARIDRRALTHKEINQILKP